jgi:hypothetical protein
MPGILRRADRQGRRASPRRRSRVAGSPLGELHARGQPELGVDVGQVGSLAARVQPSFATATASAGPLSGPHTCLIHGDGRAMVEAVPENQEWAYAAQSSHARKLTMITSAGHSRVTSSGPGDTRGRPRDGETISHKQPRSHGAGTHGSRSNPASVGRQRPTLVPVWPGTAEKPLMPELPIKKRPNPWCTAQITDRCLGLPHRGEHRHS